MTATHPEIVILDDDKHFCEALKSELETRGFTVKASAPTESFLRSLIKNPPSDLLIDVYLGPWDASEWLGWLQSEGMDMQACRIWLVSGAESSPADKLNRQYPCVQTTWFGKPVDVDELVTKLRSRLDRKVPTDAMLDVLPLPTRVIDDRGGIYYTNAHWRAAANRPDPGWYLPFSKILASEPPEYWGPLPGDPDKFGRYRVRSFVLPEDSELMRTCVESGSPANLLVQIVETMPETQPESLDSLFDKAFQTLRDAGFSRMRYYRIVDVPGCDGIVELRNVKGKHEKLEKLKLPLSRPHDGEYAKRFKVYRRTTKPDPNQLIYDIRERDNDLEQRDPGLAFWNRLVLSEGQQSWLDIPLLRKIADRDYRPVGLLVLDRVGSSGISDGVPEQVTRAQVERIASTLRNTFNQAIPIMKREEKTSELRLKRHVDSWDKWLGQMAMDRHSVQDALLKMAMRLTRADTGTLVVCEQGTEALVIEASRGIPSEFTRDARFPLDAERFLSVRCWKSREPQYLPDSTKLPKEQRLTLEDYTRICPQHGDKFFYYLEEKQRSVVALPIKYGDRISGVLALQSKYPYHFTAPLVSLLQTLLNRARWYLHLALEEESRRMWEGYSMMHELRSDIQVFNQGVRALEQYSADPTGTAYQAALRRVMRYGLSMEDLTNDFMELVNPGSQRPSSISWNAPGTILKDFLALYEEEFAWFEQTIQCTPNDWDKPEWQVNLAGSPNTFARVIRNLLQNALRYSGTNAEIRLGARQENSLWCLEVWNPGHMTEEEDRLKFVPFKKSEGSRRDGSHIGLAASQKLTLASGGKLDLVNLTDEYGKKWVRASLHWPLQSQEKSYP